MIACNTASSVSLDALKNSVAIPVLGVIEPGSKAAVKATQNRKIGVIGTSATVQSNAYTTAIHAIDPAIQVFGLACPLFVPLVEEGWITGNMAMMIAKQYLSGIKEKGIDTHIDNVEVNFKNKFAQSALTYSSCLADRFHCQGCLWCLRNFLTENTYRALISKKPDVIISCGSSLAPVNFILARENLAKSMVVVRMGIRRATDITIERIAIARATSVHIRVEPDLHVSCRGFGTVTGGQKERIR